jgi:hypothetical protein
MSGGRPSLLLSLSLDLLVAPGLGHWHARYRRRGTLFLVPAVVLAVTATTLLVLDALGALPGQPPESVSQAWSLALAIERQILDQHGTLYALLLGPLAGVYVASALDLVQLALRGYPGQAHDPAPQGPDSA